MEEKEVRHLSKAGQKHKQESAEFSKDNPSAKESPSPHKLQHHAYE